jgi:hypothetical protein
MRRAIAFGVASGLTSALAIAAACNPIFGIVSRTEGPTWCEEEAQAGSAYCDDFDREAGRATATELPQTLNGTNQITDAVASSPPNSLEVTSTAVTNDASGVLLGNLASFGSSLALPVQCRVDVRPAEIAVAARGGEIGVAAIGGQTVKGNGSGPGPVELVYVSFGPDGARAGFATSTEPNAPVTRKGTDCGPFFLEAPEAEWATLIVSLVPSKFLDGSIPACMIDRGDAGTKKKDAGAQADATSGSTYVVLLQYDVFQYAVVVPDPNFVGQPYFAYGISIIGASPPVTLHFDNAACFALTPGGP